MEGEDVCSNCVDKIPDCCIQCSVCLDLKLCVSCFRLGAEIGDHKRDHDYTVQNVSGPVVFNEDSSDDTKCSQPWSFKEEMRLLDGVEVFNLGSWDSMKEHMHLTHTADEISNHYERFYLKGRLGKEIVSKLSYADQTDHTNTILEKFAANSGSSKNEKNLNKWSAQELRLLAYMPRRDDFEKEYVNDAETLISNLTALSCSDHQELEREVCLSVVDIFLDRLRLREKCKALINDYDLVTQFLKLEKNTNSDNNWKYSPVDVRRMKEERDLKEKLRWCCQFIPSAEFEMLISNLMKQKVIKARIDELQGFLKNGIKSLKGKKEFSLDLTPRRRRKLKKLRFSRAHKKHPLSLRRR